VVAVLISMVKPLGTEQIHAYQREAGGYFTSVGQIGDEAALEQALSSRGDWSPKALQQCNSGLERNWQNVWKKL